MEAEFQDRLKDLNTQLTDERQKKAALDKELAEVRHELDNIEARFPEELSELRDQIKFAKE
jgi:predicted  nucleic acid-binding Zn-ribbon protein